MKKKIIIFTSGGGGGHISVSNALETYLGQQYEVITSYLFRDLLKPIDPGRVLSCHQHSGEDIYNFFIRHKWCRLLNLMYSFGKWYYKFRHKRVEQLIRDYLIKEKPDLIISVIPITNNQLLTVAQELNIPFTLIPTDLDTKTFVNGLKNLRYKKLTVMLPFDEPLIKNTLASAHIPTQQINVTGFALRKDFFETKDIPALKHTLHIPADKPVLLLMMGTQGSYELYNFFTSLLSIKHPAHIIAAVGKNEKVKKRLEAISLPPHISASIIGFCSNISDYLATADLFITKSGTVSVCEGIYMNKPMLLDATSSVVKWELLNHQLVKEHQFGDLITNIHRLPQQVEDLLANNQKGLKEFKQALMNYRKENPEQKIAQLIADILE